MSHTVQRRSLPLKEVASPHTNGEQVSLGNPSEIRENGSTNGDKIKVERPPSRSGSSSSRSTPSLKREAVDAWFETPLDDAEPGRRPRRQWPQGGPRPVPPYPLGSARGPEHLSPYNNVAPSPYGRPAMMGYDGHPHARTPGIATNGMGTIPGGKPGVEQQLRTELHRGPEPEHPGGQAIGVRHGSWSLCLRFEESERELKSRAVQQNAFD
ncbi:hypothetical protein NQ318_009213 [Aromia moschata]|uniref:Uncharacterized protein n=1 Tax=Aromia moschata TaxID=1265417 RepID=A0AAV8XP94_9CUCU|nr:hypothetical protein NQ318_009213 [Aromia moschata]